ncbi:glycerophosphodiester phosphodiesterase [Streptomyces polyrhachis]|uniref:Glycerophosphodiester phosphodiesterase n=1 Tax=Streptomyces polyrhachis TaxID=1282885 RepID=A0ABW2GGX2_9ACTN
MTAIAAALAAAAVLAETTAGATPYPSTVYAHRGFSYAAPENTLPAVDAAAAAGIEWMENDVQRTRDGALVVIHDATLARTTDVEAKFPTRSPWRVGDFTQAEINTLDAGSWKGPQWTGTRVPTLARYLARLDANGQRLLLEVKRPELHPGLAADVVAELRRLGWLGTAHTGRLIVQSFDLASLKAVRTRAPQVRTAFLTDDPSLANLPGCTAVADQIHLEHTRVTAAYVDAVHLRRGPHRRQVKLVVWTVDDPARTGQLLALRVDGFITNRPDAISEAATTA